MSTDMGITDPNNCIFMEATPGDGGVHSAATWWLSPDAIMTGADPSVANPGANTTNVRVHWKGNCALSGPSAVLFELYVGNPSLAMSPLNTKQLAAPTVVPGIAAGSAAVVPVNWTPSANAGDPDGPGHKCLVARAYPVGSTPDPGDLSGHLPTDQHYVQHNLTVVGAGAGPQKITINTGNKEREEQTATVLVQHDLQPSKFVLNAITPSLKTVRGFKQVSNKQLAHVSIDLSAFEKAALKVQPARKIPALHVQTNLVADVKTKLFGALAHPNLQAAVALQPRFFSTFTLAVDLTGTHSGDAHVFHLTQKNAKGQFDGGLTVVFVTH